MQRKNVKGNHAIITHAPTLSVRGDTYAYLRRRALPTGKFASMLIVVEELSEQRSADGSSRSLLFFGPHETSESSSSSTATDSRRPLLSLRTAYKEVPCMEHTRPEASLRSEASVTRGMAFIC